LSVIFAALFVIVFSVYFIFSYQKPTCFDGIQNQGELGIDCGGECLQLCPFEVREPIVHWSRAFEVSPGIYSAVAFLENPNFNSSTEKVSYRFRLLDSFGAVLSEAGGEISIPNSRNAVVFEPNIRTDGRVARTDFIFLEEVVWYKDESVQPDIMVGRKNLTAEDSAPRLDVQLENVSIFNIDRLEVAALVFDGNKNAIGASRTFIDDFRTGARESFVFTWPRPFEVQEFVCENPVDLMLVFDRSGSMVFDNWDLDNPEPLNSAKRAALGFLEKLFSNVRVGLVSFATEASLDISLVGDPASAKDAVDKISVKAETPDEVWTQETNIAEGLELALFELERSQNEKAVVLFTDGVPTHPKMTGQPDYPIYLAKEISLAIKDVGAVMFVVGLGQEQIDEDFLREIAHSPEYYFGATNSSDLFPVFSSLAEKICKEAPTVVEIITREVDNS